MKNLKYLFFFLSLIVSTGLIACSDKTEEVSPEPENPEQPDKPTDPELAETCRKMREQITTTNSYVSDMSATNSDAEKYMGMMKEDGYFSDIDYKDKSRVNWEPIKHLERIEKMVISYIRKDSKLFQNDGLYDKIEKGLDYWNRVRPSSDNWWHDQIGEPKLLGCLLVMMRNGKETLPDALEKGLLGYMEKTGGDPRKQSGANKTDVALHWLYRGSLEEDKEVLEVSTSEAFYPLMYTTKEGIQYDNSYFQHGKQLYIGGYAPVLLNGVSEVALYTAGTEYFMTDEQKDIMYKFVSETLLKSIRNNKIFYNVIGRSVSRENGLNANMSTLVTRMKQTDGTHSADYAKLLELIKTGDYSAVPETHTHYYVGDYTLYQSSTYSAGLRAYSTRTAKCEKGNDENLKGYFMTEGSMALSIYGDEYEYVFPVWDWCKIPGVTVPLMSKVPDGGSGWEQIGTSDFVGGVSDGKIGSFAFKMNLADNGVEVAANKSWFFWGKEIYCLGNSISSSMAENIATTVNQCNLNGDIIYSQNNSENVLSLGGNVTKANVDWVWHRNIGYIFPKKENNICISAEERSGSWKDINLSQSDKKITRNIYALWVDHGSKPVNGMYEYIIIPGIDKSAMSAYKYDKFDVLSNTEVVQSVYNKETKTLQAIFYKNGTLKVDEWEVSVSDRCAIIVKDNGSVFNISVSTPSQDISDLEITLKFNGKTVTHKEIFNDGYHNGKTHVFNMNISGN